MTEEVWDDRPVTLLQLSELLQPHSSSSSLRHYAHTHLGPSQSSPRATPDMISFICFQRQAGPPIPGESEKAREQEVFGGGGC